MLLDEGWAVLARRARTPAGELDLVVRRGAMLAFVEVKARPRLAEAAFALGPRQRARLLAAAEAWLAGNPVEPTTELRFDVILVDAEGRARRIADALREGTG